MPADRQEARSAARGRLYERTFDMETAGVGVLIGEQYDGTIWVHFGNEHGSYAFEVTPQESAELRATLATAESRIEERP